MNTNAHHVTQPAPGTYRRQVRSKRLGLPTFKFGQNLPITLVDLGIVLVWAGLITAILV